MSVSVGVFLYLCFMNRKQFSEFKKKKEQEIKLRTIEKYPEIHQMYLDGEISIKDAYNHCMSEMLSIQGYKSKGTKGFITDTKIGKKKITNPTPTLPYGKHPLVDDDSFNPDFDTINRMTYEEFKTYSNKLRNELLRIWEEEGIPPYIGKDLEGILEDFKGVSTFDIDKLYKEGDNDFKFVLSNDWRYGSSCNQFTPSLHKTKVNKGSMYELLKEPKWTLQWQRMMTRNLKQDKIYGFSNRINSLKEIIDLDKETYGFLLHPHPSDSESFSIDKKLINELIYKNILEDFHIRNLDLDWDNYERFQIRYYKKTDKSFSNKIHVLRTGFTNTPTNFSPLISRYLYEKYLPKNKPSVVLDTSCGWGGRFLGSVCSKNDITYIGCDVNSSLFEPNNSYDSIYDFINKHIGIESKYEIHQISSTEFDKTDSYKKYKGKVDMFLSSPPYYITELYSDDKDQSYNLFPKYSDWLNGYLRKTFEIVYDMMKEDGIVFLNIADISVNQIDFPLELDSIQILEEIGFRYDFSIGMKMQKYLGLNIDNIINRYYDKEKDKWVKVEPVMCFRK